MAEGDKFRFEEFASTLYTVLSISDLPKNRMSIKTEALMQVYEQEKYRQERIESLESEANAPTN